MLGMANVFPTLRAAPPAVQCAADRSVSEDRSCSTGAHARPPAPATRRSAVVRLPRMHLHMLRHTFVDTMLDAGVDVRDVQVATRHATHGPPCDPTEAQRTRPPSESSGVGAGAQGIQSPAVSITAG